MPHRVTGGTVVPPVPPPATITCCAVDAAASIVVVVVVVGAEVGAVQGRQAVLHRRGLRHLVEGQPVQVLLARNLEVLVVRVGRVCCIPIQLNNNKKIMKITMISSSSSCGASDMPETKCLSFLSLC